MAANPHLFGLDMPPLNLPAVRPARQSAHNPAPSVVETFQRSHRVTASDHQRNLEAEQAFREYHANNPAQNVCPVTTQPESEAEKKERALQELRAELGMVTVKPQVECFGCGGNHKMTVNDCDFFRWFKANGGLFEPNSSIGPKKGKVFVWDNEGVPQMENETGEEAFMKHQIGLRVKQGDAFAMSRYWAVSGSDPVKARKIQKEFLTKLSEFEDIKNRAAYLGYSLEKFAYIKYVNDTGLLISCFCFG